MNLPTFLLTTNLGLQTEWTPLTQWTDFVNSEASLHPLSTPYSGLTPWLTLEQTDWRFRTTLFPEIIQSTSTTATNQETYTFGTIKGSMAIERLFTESNLQWNIGAGIGYSHPLWSIKSDAFTREEQASINAQNSVTNAQIRGLDIHIPLSMSTPLTERLDLGIGITYHWMIQYVSSDTERQWIHHIYPIPSVYLRL